MVNPFAEVADVRQHAYNNEQHQYEHPHQDSTGAVDFVFNSHNRHPHTNNPKPGNNPFSQDIDWNVPV